ncbi:MAG: hypothetical protein HYY03_03525 [Chloroflexi bacterium]|nr:hypothetical protein [Chloroflexota bacterium]
MTTRLSPDSRGTLQRYVDGRISNAELAEWLVAAEYDDELAQGERDELARLRLIVTEVEEDLRPADEILKAVSAILAVTEDKIVVAVRTSSSTHTKPGSAVTAAASPVQHAGIAP